MSSNILVNATASRASGALSILRQFIDAIPSCDNNQYYIFVDLDFVVTRKAENIQYVQIDTRQWLKRILWEEVGVNRWINQEKKEIDLYVSFQNMGSKINPIIPQLIYYHQLLPLFEKRWNCFAKEERLFFLYKKFYSFFVHRYIKENTTIVVQSASIKDAFLKKFKVSPSKVYAIMPSISIINYTEVEEIKFDDGCIHCIYPATPLVYKNHDDIVEVLKVIREKDNSLFTKIRVHFTFGIEDAKKLYMKIVRSGLENNVLFDGVIPFEKLKAYYKSASLLLFPSYIETLGLPLLEAAIAGMPIVVSDLPYARDVVGEYEGAKFVKLHNIKDWSDSVIKELYAQSRYTPYLPSAGDGWKPFLNLINQLKK